MTRVWTHRFAAIFCLALTGLVHPALARTLTAGSGGAFAAPSAAIAKAQPGDVVRIAPGRYRDCAVLNASNVTVEGNKPGVIMADKVCQGKAILVVNGHDDTLRNLTLTGARDADGNGAGIRAEGGSLLVDHVTFVGNQEGLLAGKMPDAVISIIDSKFVRDGTCVAACAHGVYVGAIKKLIVRGTVFRDIQTGHAIKSRAASTVIIHDTIMDGEHGTSSYLIDLPNGGNLLMRHDRLEKGVNSSNPDTAISIGEEGHAPAHARVAISHVTFTNDTGDTTTFVRNETKAPVLIKDSTLHGGVTPLAGPGRVRHTEVSAG